LNWRAAAAEAKDADAFPSRPERSTLSAASAAPSPERRPQAKFTTGSLMRHVVVMTATGSIGLVAVFAVDALSLFWVSRLGDQALKAAIGYASQVSFLLMAVNIGLTIAISAVVSRALGAGDRIRARRLSASGTMVTLIATIVLSALMFAWRDAMLAGAMHADGRSAEIASRVLAIVLPSNVLLGLGMALSGVLRAVGDARRAMYVTLSGAVVTAFLDPLLIFGCGLGVYGAAWTIVVARLVVFLTGVEGAVRAHDLVATPRLKAPRGDLAPLFAIGAPAILTNLATPVSSVYVTRVWSDFGEATVAGGAIVDRVVPLAFAVVFALTGSIGPIIGQNYGAKLFDRVERTLTDSFVVAVGYAFVAWAALAIGAGAIVDAFAARGASADFVLLCCRVGVFAWVFMACLFVANTAFNNLGFPVLATLFNWGRATLGTIPFITLGALWGGVPGAVVGLILGAAIFGLGGVWAAYAVVRRLARRAAPAEPAAPARLENATKPQ
jgi:putative MATE family efflux protein